MRILLLSLAALLVVNHASAEPFEIKDGDRVLFLGDTLLEREGNYGYLETRMVEQFPDRKFTVRNLAFSGDTPLGWSRASFDPAAKGFERLREQLALVKPTVVFLGYGMAASLQEMTDRSQDWTLNRDAARYGAEPMSAARFKKELAQCMDLIEEVSADSADLRRKDETSPASENLRPSAKSADKKSAVRFVLLSPIRHEDLRATRPGLPDPTEHNNLLEQYSKAIEDLAKERGALFLNMPAAMNAGADGMTENGIHLSERGYGRLANEIVAPALGWKNRESEIVNRKSASALRSAIIRKNELFFHQWRPANETYLFGFRKHEQGQNAKEMPMFDPLIAKAEAEIERLKKSSAQSSVPSGQSAQAPVTSHQSPVTAPVPFTSQPHPTFTLADGLEISLWAENPLLAKPTQMNWDAQGRLWIASSAMYPQIAPGQTAFDKILVLEDTNGDGKAEKSTVFVDGLLIPTGVAPVLVAKDGGRRMKDEKSAVASPQGVGKDAAQSGHSNPSSFNLHPSTFGCYVGQSTELLYFEDTDGDGKADKKRIVFGGFGTEDTHHIVHTLRWGPDGRLYFNQSIYIHTHLETPWGMVRLNSGGILAYDPRSERVEVFAKGWVNSWGHAWDQWGQSFVTDGAGGGGINWTFPGGQFVTYEGARRILPSISPGSYPKFCGLELIYSPHFPADWQGTAVTNDFRAHKVVQFKITDLGNPQISQISADGKREGSGTPAQPASSSNNLRPSAQSADNSSLKSGYTAEQIATLVQTSDATFRPIDVKLGPDGALYIADWSNPIINHGEVDFRDPRRDKTHGRIWRLSVKGGKAVKWESLVGKKVGDLIKLLTSANAWERANAQRSLIQAAGSQTAEMWGDDVSEDKTGVRPALVGALAGGNSETIAAVWGVARAVNFDYFHAGPEGRMFQAAALETSAEDSRWRALATRRAGAWLCQSAYNIESDDEAVGASSVLSDDILPALAGDKSPRVRVEAMRALARIPSIESASLILGAAINAPTEDPFYDFAAWRSINDLADIWTKAVLAGEWKPEGREKQLEFALNALDAAQTGPVLAFLLRDRPLARDGAGPWIELIGKGGGRAEVQMLAARVAQGEFDQAALVRAMNSLADAARVRDLRPEAPSPRVAELIDSPDAATRTAAARLAGLWRIAAAAPRLEALAAAPAADLRAAAFDGLRALGGPAVPVLQRLVKSTNPAVPPPALAALAQVKPDAALAEIPAVFGAMKSEQEMMQTWRAILQSGGAMNQLANRFPADVPKPVLVTALRAARELGRKGQPLANKLAPLAGEVATARGSANYADLAARAKKDGDPVAGEALYRRTASACVTCHAIGGAGGKLGPDMTSIGASAPPDYIIESILDPAAKVKEGYHAFAFAMKDGTEAIGIPSRETAQEQFIRTVAGEQPLPKANITGKKLADGGASLMPAGLVNAWSDRERLNLYAFLAELGRPGPFDASKNNVARVWQLADTGKVDGALKAEAASAPSTTPVYTLVDGRLTKDLLAEKFMMLQPKNDAVQLAARFQAAAAGKAKFQFTGIRKAWLDGQPLAVASEPSPGIELTPGAHTLTIEVDSKNPPEVIRAESAAVSFLGD